MNDKTPKIVLFDMGGIMKHFVMLALLCLALASCGGGGGGDSAPVPTASTSTFQLKTAYLSSFSTSSSTPFTISGTSSGVSITGSGTSSDSSLTSTIFEGVSCYQEVTTITGTIFGNGTSVPYGGTTTSYYDANYNYLGQSGTDYSVTVGTMNLPLTAKVGDTDIAYTEKIYPSSAKTFTTGTITNSFSLEPDTATTALLKLISVKRDTSNSIVATSIDTMRITPSGTVTRLYGTYVTSTSNLRMEF